jgi:hypothetical protein
MGEPISPYELDFNPYSLPTDFIKAIGLVTAATGQTEDTIEQLIAGCIGVDFEYGLTVTLHMTMPQRFGAIRAATEIRLNDLDALDELDELIERAEKAFERRNSIVHHQWCIEPKTGRVFTVRQKARRSLKTDVIEMGVKEIEEVAKEMYDVGMALYVFSQNHDLNPLFPSQPRPRFHKTQAARKKRRELLARGKAIEP